MKRIFAALVFMSVFPPMASANVSSYKANASCFVQLLPNQDDMGKYDVLNTTVTSKVEIPSEFTIDDLLEKRYQKATSKVINENVNVEMAFNYSPLTPQFSGSNQAQINLSIESKNNANCGAKYFFTIPVGKGNKIDLIQPISNSCKEWQNIWIQCFVTSTDSR